MRNWLENQLVVLSGASGGIGKELAKLLIQKYRAKVLGIGRSQEKMQALQRELGELAPAFSYRLFDVSEKENWVALQRELRENDLSPVLLINNAAVFPPLQRALSSSSDVLQETIRTNFLSVVYAIEALSPLLKANGKALPAIVNVASSAALCPVVGSAAYSASKGALKAYVEALQLEERGKKYVGIFYPGTTATDLFRNDSNVRESAMTKIAASPQKMAKKIARKIYKCKHRAVLGWDAKAMYLLAKLMPVKGPALVCKFMKLSKSKAFLNVFETQKKE